MKLDEVLAKFQFLNDERIEAIRNYGFRDGEVDEFSIMEFFIKKGDIEAVQLALENGIDVNLSESKDFGSSLLHIAIRYGQMEIFNLLLEKGADINFVDKVGWTPLMESVVDDRPEFGKILVEKGANKDFVNHRGATAKALAQKFGRSAFLSFL
ncbi:MAG TPA: ankyrin repeat domain-containing protein [Campylobacterales bacterium]|nr:ankyrin repeat domain-containing protein [Campylobacterales bacterium]HIO70876.1 ankyrin repeat domain-containing protein [Campylobacterales bacterium]